MIFKFSNPCSHEEKTRDEVCIATNIQRKFPAGCSVKNIFWRRIPPHYNTIQVAYAEFLILAYACLHMFIAGSFSYTYHYYALSKIMLLNSLDFIEQCLAICHRDLCNFPFLFSGNKSFCFRSNQPLSIILEFPQCYVYFVSRCVGGFVLCNLFVCNIISTRMCLELLLLDLPAKLALI